MRPTFLALPLLLLIASAPNVAVASDDTVDLKFSSEHVGIDPNSWELLQGVCPAKI